MMMLPRFQVVDVDNRSTNNKGIKDHQSDKIVVLLKEIVDEQTTISIAEDIISVIENHLQSEEEVDVDDNQAEP